VDIHESAMIHPSAILGKNVKVGPFSIIEANVKIGDNAEVSSSVRIEQETIIGENCRIFHGAYLGGGPQILDFGQITSSVEIGEGTLIREYATVHRSKEDKGVTRVGAHCMLMGYTHVAHDCQIGDNVVMANYSGLSGHVKVGDFAFISGQVGVHQFVNIGMHSMLGGFTKVKQDILPFSMVDGIPSHLIGVNSVGLNRRGFSSATVLALKKSMRLIKSSELNTSQAIEKIKAEVELTSEVNHLLDFIDKSSRGITK
jgi:UDP-N-acetylglucosamine acyltransferase